MNTATMRHPVQLHGCWERAGIDIETGRLPLLLRISTAPSLAARVERPSIDVAFVVDRSGSMSGAALELAKRAVIEASTLLSATDRIAVVVFDSDVGVLQPLTPATAEVKRHLQRELSRIDAGSATCLSGGWLAGCQELAMGQSDDVSKPMQRSILLTDGHANNGIVDPRELGHHAAELRRRSVFTSTIGLGDGYDEFLLTDLAEAGGGNHSCVGNPSDIGAVFQREIGELLETIAVHVQLELTLPPGLRATFLNSFPMTRHAKVITVELRDLTANDEIELVFEATTRPGSRQAVGPTMAELSWTDAQTARRQTLSTTLDGLTPMPRIEFAMLPVNHAVSEAFAMEQSARDQREAIRLDREGRFAESRQVFAMAHDRLMQAPASARVLEQRGITADAAAAALHAFSEHDRKERVEFQSRYSRGRRPRRDQ